jgi:PAS domain S-box-containing protein
MQHGDSSLARSATGPGQGPRKAESLHRFVADHINDIVTLYDLDGKRVYASPAFERILGSPTSPELDGLHPEDRARAIAAWVRAGKGQGQTLSYRHRDVDGAWRSLEAKLKPVMFRGKPHVLAISRDLTEHHALEAQLRHAQKMESLGRLSGGVAHDFNNLLTAISGYAELALQDIPAGSEASESIREIKLAAERAGKVTRQLLTFSRREPRRSALVDPGAVAAGLERMLRLLLGEDVGLRIDRSPRKLLAHCDPAQLEQVIVNLVSNARDASGPGTEVRVKCDAKTVRASDRSVPCFVDPGDYVRIRVADSGTGMAPEVATQAFEPFFTTKPAEIGTGLGLSTAFRIVKEAAGFIWIESAPGKGTIVQMLLPRAAAKAPAAPLAGGGIRPISLKGLTIALVEDDARGRRLAAQTLRRSGARVFAFGSGGETLRALIGDGQKVDVLVTDVVLPGMTGVSLAAAARHLRPELIVLFMTGYAADLVAERELGLAEPLLEKPFTASALLREVAGLAGASLPAAARRAASR